MLGKPCSQDGVITAGVDVWKQYKPALQLGVIRQSCTNFAKRQICAKAQRLAGFRICRRGRHDAENRQSQAEICCRAIRIEKQQRLARRGKRQFNSRKDDNPFVRENGSAIAARFLLCCSPDVLHEYDIVMIRYGDRIQSFRSTGTYKVTGINGPGLLCNRTVASPVTIARTVHLKVTGKEMCSAVHPETIVHLLACKQCIHSVRPLPARPPPHGSCPSHAGRT